MFQDVITIFTLLANQQSTQPFFILFTKGRAFNPEALLKVPTVFKNSSCLHSFVLADECVKICDLLGLGGVYGVLGLTDILEGGRNEG